MEVILTKDVDSLGDQGEVVAVAEGFARNYLFPKKMAIRVTDGSMKDLSVRIERIRVKTEKKHQENLVKAEKINALGLITLEANAGDTGKLYGAITTKDLAVVIQEKAQLTVERKQINTNAPVNRVGEYEVYVKFSAKVSGQFGLKVMPTKDEAELAYAAAQPQQEDADDDLV